MVLVDMRMVDAGVPAVVMGQDVMVEGGVLAAPEAAIAVIPLRVELAVLHGLGNQAPLHGEILVAVEGSRLVHAPAHGAVVQDDMVQITAPDAVLAVGLAGLDLGGGPGSLVTEPETQETDDHVIGTLGQIRRIVFEADTVAGSRLARNGQIAFGDFEVGLQFDRAGHVEDNRERTLPFLDPVTQRSAG